VTRSPQPVIDLRDFAAAHVGTLRLHPGPTAINDLLSQVVEAHRGSVERTGTGVPTTDRPRASDRFWIAEAFGSWSTGGSGSGVSIVRSLAEAHGGTVSAVSELGVGQHPRPQPASIVTCGMTA
jgi:signal transduction histidine kinase